MSAVLTQMVVRIIVSRPQPAVSAALVATDDALRAEAVQRLAGAGLLASFLATLAALWVASFAATNLWIRAGGVTLMILTLVLPIASAVATRRSAARPTRLPVVRH